MSLRDRIVVEKVLTNHILGYNLPDEVGDALFPDVPVESAESRVVRFDKDSNQVYDTSRAPGTPYHEVEFGYYAEKVRLGNHGVTGKVPREEKREMDRIPGFSTASAAIDNVYRVEMRSCEKEKADIARNPDNYGADNKIQLTGGDKWSAKDTSDPVVDVEAGKEVILDATGAEPNTIVIPQKVFKFLKWHPVILDSIPNQKVKKATVNHLKDIFEIEHIIIAKSMGYDKTTQKAVYFWGTDVILANVNREKVKNRKTPSYGYNYVLKGHPFVEPPWFDKKNKSYMYDVTNESQAIITDSDSGYLIRDAA